MLSLYKNRAGFYRISIKRVDLSNTGRFGIWIEICKLNAFCRIYVLLLKNKKFNLGQIIRLILIITLGIPFRFLHMCHFFIVKNETNFRKGLEIFYNNLFLQLKNCKIEMLNGRIYLNCYTINKLAAELKTRNPKMSQQKAFDTIIDLKRLVYKLNDYESKKGLVEMKLAKIFDESGKQICSPHFTSVFQKITIHATSNLPKLTEFQRAETPMASLIKKGALNPHSIITTNVGRVRTSQTNFFISEFELINIKAKHRDLFNVDLKELQYISLKKEMFRDILENAGITKDSKLLDELNSNLYVFTLMSSGNHDISNILKSVYKFENDPTH